MKASVNYHTHVGSVITGRCGGDFTFLLHQNILKGSEFDSRVHFCLFSSYYVEMMCLNPSGTSELLGLIWNMFILTVSALCAVTEPFTQTPTCFFLSFWNRMDANQTSIFTLSRCCMFVTWRRKSTLLVVLTCCLVLYRCLFNVLIKHKVSTAGTCCIMMWDPLSSRMTLYPIKWLFHNSDHCEPLFLPLKVIPVITKVAL